MSPKQKKLAAKAPPPNKLDEKDFAVLREEKAKGRGMGLQDEKVKPGKIQKAALGMLALGAMGAMGAKKFMKKKNKVMDSGELPKSTMPINLVEEYKKALGKKMGGVMKAKRGVFSSGKISDMSFDEKMKRVESGQINKKTGKFTSMNAMRDAKGFQKGESAAEFNKRRMKLAGAKKALASTRIGKIVLPIAAAGVAAQQYLKSKMKKKDEPKKKMGGGMMQKPMGYKHGTKPGAGPLAGLGRPASRSQQQKKKERPDVVIMMPVKEGPAKQNTTIKTFKIKNRMGGGMMKKYSKGGGYDSGNPGKLRDYSSKFRKDGVTFKNPRVKGPDQSPRLKKLIERKKALDTTKSVLKTLSSVASPATAAASAAYKLANKMKDKDRMTDRDLDKARSLVGTSGSKNRPIKKDHSSRNPNPKTPKMMGGGMMMQKPMGYSKGIMVKARGCKLGRTRPTKIT